MILDLSTLAISSSFWKVPPISVFLAPFLSPILRLFNLFDLTLPHRHVHSPFVTSCTWRRWRAMPTEPPQCNSDLKKNEKHPMTTTVRRQAWPRWTLGLSAESRVRRREPFTQNSPFGRADIFKKNCQNEIFWRFFFKKSFLAHRLWLFVRQ